MADLIYRGASKMIIDLELSEPSEFRFPLEEKQGFFDRTPQHFAKHLYVGYSF